MNKPSIPPEAAAQDAPLNQFSQCHAGILTSLQAFGSLPALAESAAQARKIAAATIEFFRDVIYTHHAEEEKELFPAVLASALEGEERNHVLDVIARLTKEHRQVEAAWTRVEPAMRDIAKGRDAALDADAVHAMVDMYRAHASYEEQHFLPLSQTMLMRDSKQMSALGLSMHMRHVLPDMLTWIAGRG